ncbi:MAG: hypothetical protein ABI321_22470 [Polyangia bacterium]
MLAYATPALAFLEPSQFFAPKMVPHTATLGANAEGIYFTGAPRFSGIDCSSCHTDGPRKVTLDLGVDDVTLFSTGYVPGQTYELSVTLGNETEGLEYSTPTCTDVPPSDSGVTYQQCNNNNFALEIDTATGPVTGTSFCAAPPSQGSCPAKSSSGDEVVVAPDGDAVFANDAHSMSMPYQRLANDATSWHLWWSAPAAGSGPVTIYVAAVDGNGGSGTVTSDQDPYGDDTVRGVFHVREAGGTATLDASAGCSAVPGASGAGQALVVLMALAWLRSTGRRRTR